MTSDHWAGRVVGALVISILAASTAPVVWFVVDGEWPWGLTGLLALISAPWLAATGWTAVRLRTGHPPPFDPGVLVGSTRLVAVASASWTFGYVGAVCSVVLLPPASGRLAVARVRPVPGDRTITFLVGLGLCPLVVWFVGRADEAWIEALLGGAGIFAASLLLLRLRRRARAALPQDGRSLSPEGGPPRRRRP